MAQDKKKKDFKSALHLMEGVEQPSSVNEQLLKKMKQKKTAEIQPEVLFEGLAKGNRVMLGKAITLIESNLDIHRDTARIMIELCLPLSGNSVRIGVTGVPGVGKSTFIEAIGMHLIEKGHKIAVLAVDPSSARSKGSILGDKTRMEHLAAHEHAFIRPSPSAGTLGGVTRKTHETIILCEAAGYDIIFVETVGVGQSEVAVKNMVDFFLLLVLAGAGDELQGIKRGIMEMADAVIVHKADEDNLLPALTKITTYEHALHFFPTADSGWMPKVTECSSVTGHHIPEVWTIVKEYINHTKANGYFQNNRQEQEVRRLFVTLEEYLKTSFFNHPEIKAVFPSYEQKIRERKISPYEAAGELIKRLNTL